MLNSKRILLFMTVVFVAFILYLCGSCDGENAVSFRIDSGENSKEISLWKNEAGVFYVFLPSDSSLEQVQVVVNTDSPVRIDGVQLKSGMTCETFSQEMPYSFSYFSRGHQKSAEIVFLRSSDLAAMYIETQSGSMDYIHKEKGNKESGTIALYLPDGTMTYSGKLESIQGRGNSTWTASEKKPYSIGLEEEQDLLGLGSARKWVLLANAKDPSHMRNKAIYDFADRVGMSYAPDSDWVDLYLNGEYAGLYLLSERNEVHPQRVAISRENSFLVSLELQTRIEAQDYPYISTDSGQYLRIHYPVQPGTTQLQEMEKLWQSLENAILAEDNMDPITGKTWMELIDLDSWVKKYLIEEIFGNIDACYISQFFYYDANKLYAGPVWDYDQSMGLESAWQLAAGQVLLANRYTVNVSHNTPWFHVLYQKAVFRDRMRVIYQRDFLPVIHDFLNDYLLEYGNRISRAHMLDQIRWNLRNPTIAEQIELLQNFMKERIVFLNIIWLEAESYYIVSAENKKGGNYGRFAVLPGEKLAALPDFKSTGTLEFLGWYDADTGEIFSFDRQIDKNITIQARWRNKPVLWLIRIGKVSPAAVMGILFLSFLAVDRRRRKLVTL